MKKISELEVSNLSNGFPGKFCTDAYDFSLFALKKLKFAIVSALTNILNLCIMHSNIANVFKLVKTALIHKDCALSRPRNFREFTSALQKRFWALAL